MATKRKTRVEAARQAAHYLLDQLPPDDLHAARRYLEYLRHEGGLFVRKLMEAPAEDEELSEETLKAIDQGLEDIRAGRTTPLEEVEAEFGA